VELPPSKAAAVLLDDARHAGRAARAGVSSNALGRVARLDVASLKVIARYLELLDELVTASREAASGLVQEGPKNKAGSASAAARDAVRQSLEAVDRLLAATGGGAS